MDATDQYILNLEYIDESKATRIGFKVEMGAHSSFVFERMSKPDLKIVLGMLFHHYIHVPLLHPLLLILVPFFSPYTKPSSQPILEYKMGASKSSAGIQIHGKLLVLFRLAF